MKTKRIKVTHTYVIKYEHEDHLAKLTKEAMERAVLMIGGAGYASDGQVYSYSIERVGKGKLC